MHSFSSATSFLPIPAVSGPMSRWLFPWSGSIKKRACRYLLQHYLGHFLQERLSLDQLGLDLYNGSGLIKEINLDVWVSFKRGGKLMSRCFQQVVILCFCRAHSMKVSQLLRSSTTIFNAMLLAQLTFLRSAEINWNPSWNEINYIKIDIKLRYAFFCTSLFTFVCER